MGDITVYRNEDFKKIFTIKNQDGDAVDLTGGSVTMKISNQLPADTVILSKDATNLSSDGTCRVTFTEEDLDITPKLYYYQLTVTLSSGDKYVNDTGRFIVKKVV